MGAVEKVLNAYFRERDNLEPVSRKELLRRMRDGLVTLIDTTNACPPRCQPLSAGNVVQH